MANELKHGSVGTELTQAEWEAVGTHVVANQAVGDIIYASTTSQLSRLGKGADNTVLRLASSIPEWSATLAGLTLTTPTISSTGFANANHAHAASNSGGTVAASALSGTSLASGVVTTSATTVGVLNSGSINTGFGTIDVGSSSIAGGSFDASDGNITHVGDISLDSLSSDGNTITITPTTDTIFANGNVYVNDSANGKQTQGLTVNQGANDDEGIALKSSDITHGVTGEAEADTFGRMKKTNSATGGLSITGFRESPSVSTVLHLGGMLGSTAADTGKTTDDHGVVDLDARVSNGSTGTTACGTDENLVSIANAGTVRFIFDAEGSGHADVEFTTFDDKQDVELLRGLNGVLVPGYQEAFGEDMIYNLKTYEDMKLVGKGSVHTETRKDGREQVRGMVNFTKLSMLHHSTIIQMSDHFTDVVQSQEARLNSIEQKLLALEAA
jgi:hypothetical protein